MYRQFRTGFVMPIIIITALVLAALTPQSAFAEGEAPELPEPLAVPGEEIIAPIVEETVEMLAENNAVLMEEGAILPMASQSALEILCDPDPWYYGSGINCPGGICSYSVAIDGLKLALDNWITNKGNGYIYIEGFSSPYDIDEYSINPTVTGKAGFSTLKGLIWKGGTVKPRIEGSLSVSNMPAGFLIQGLYLHTSSINSILNFSNNKGLIKLVDVEISDSYQKGLTITNHIGSVELNQVFVHNNRLGGIEINNLGLQNSNTGSVKITNSALHHNYDTIGAPDYGLTISSAGAITLNGVTVSDSRLVGINITTYGALTIKNSAFVDTDSNGNPAGTYGAGLQVETGSTGSVLLENVLLKGNDGSGAWIQTTGNVTFKRVQAMNNGYAGVRIGNESGVIPGAKTIIISDSQFTANSSYNLLALANGSITLTNVNASGSTGEMGARLQNNLGTLPLSVTITNSVFNNNDSRGLSINSFGAITINSITVRDNDGGEAAYIDNRDYFKGITFLSTYGPNVFADNLYTGLNIWTDGNLVMNSVQAYGNGQTGVVAENVGGTILWINGGAWSNGSITALDYGTGAILDNSLLNIGKSVTLRDVFFNDNLTDPLSTDSSAGVGLNLNTNGMVTITNISADANSRGGAVIQSDAGVTLLRTFPSGYNTFNNNMGGSGITIGATSNVTLNRIQANSNYGAGAYIYTYGSTTINGTSAQPAIFNNNMGYYDSTKGYHAGLQIDYSNGAVRITNVEANYNFSDGTYISANGPVSIIGSVNHFIGNSIQPFHSESDGIHIRRAVGAVTISNFIVNDNQYNGIKIDNTGEGFGNVILNSTTPGFTSQINGNGVLVSTGLKIVTEGAVTISRVDVVGNTTHGMDIDNKDAPYSKPVSISYSNIMQNYDGNGLKVISAGQITLNKVNVSDHESGNGAYLKNDVINIGLFQTYKPVTVLNSIFNRNYGSKGGLYIESMRTITLSNITASDNDSSGVYLNNKISDIASPVMISGKNRFHSNNSYGIWIDSKGLVNMSGVESGENDYYGIYIETEKSVNLTNSIVYGTKVLDYPGWNYEGTGVFINTQNNSLANVTLNNVVSYGNGLYGLRAEAAAAKVSLLNSTFINNTDYGFYVDVYLPPVYPSLSSPYFYLFNVNYFGNKWGFVPYQVE